MEVATAILYRVYIKVKVFPRDETLQTFIGDVGSSIINSIFINIMNNVRVFNYNSEINAL
jgi:hypothetical protein